MSKRKDWDYVIDGDPVAKIDAQRGVIVQLHIRLDAANDEIARLKNLLAECAAWFRESDIASDLAERCREAGK
jgi:hypothetical protein